LFIARGVDAGATVDGRAFLPWPRGSRCWCRRERSWLAVELSRRRWVNQGELGREPPSLTCGTPSLICVRSRWRG